MNYAGPAVQAMFAILDIVAARRALSVTFRRARRVNRKLHLLGTCAGTSEPRPQVLNLRRLQAMFAILDIVAARRALSVTFRRARRVNRKLHHFVAGCFDLFFARVDRQALRKRYEILRLVLRRGRLTVSALDNEFGVSAKVPRSFAATERLDDVLRLRPEPRRAPTVFRTL